MSVLTDIFTDIANSLRSKMGVADTFTPSQMADAVNNIETVPMPAPNIQYNFSSRGLVGMTYGESALFNDVIVPGIYGNATIKYDYGDILLEGTQLNNGYCVNAFKNNKSNFAEYNAGFYFGNALTACSGCFYNCTNFNQPVFFADDFNANVFNMFSLCTNFNQPLVFPRLLNALGYMLYNCTSFNQPLVIPKNINNASALLFGCTTFNQSVIFEGGSSIEDMSGMFKNCTNFNRPLVIPASAQSVGYILEGASNFASDIYFENVSNISWAGGMISNVNRLARTNIWCNNSDYLKTETICYYRPTWTAMSDGNGYYNTYWNVYLYNNWTPT